MAGLNIEVLSKEKIENTLKAWTTGKKLLVLFLTIFLIGGTYWYFFYRNSQKEIKRLQHKIVQKKAKLAKLRNAKKKSATLQRKLLTAQEELEVLLATLPEAREIPSFLQYIADIGATCGLSQLLFEPQREEYRDFYAIIPVKLKLVGNFHKLGMFLDKLSKLNRLVRVRSLKVGHAKKNSTNIKIDMVIETYRYLQPTEQKTKTKRKKKRRGR